MDKVRRLLYIIVASLDKYILRKKPSGITIYSYHSICNDTWRFSIDVEVVKKQLDYLHKNYDIITLADVELFLQGKKQITRPSVVLTFDDGYKDMEELREFFIERKLTPTLFVLSDTEHANYAELATKRPFLSVDEIKAFHKLGWEIGSHSATHANLITLTPEELARETKEAKQDLEKALDIPIRYFAYPRGKYSKGVLDSVEEAGFTLGLTMDDGFIRQQSAPLSLPRIGVDRTHSFEEFTILNSPSVVSLRMAIKKIIGKYL